MLLQMIQQVLLSTEYFQFWGKVVHKYYLTNQSRPHISNGNSLVKCLSLYKQMVRQSYLTLQSPELNKNKTGEICMVILKYMFIICSFCFSFAPFFLNHFPVGAVLNMIGQYIFLLFVITYVWPIKYDWLIKEEAN